MKIIICGSIKAADEIIKIKNYRFKITQWQINTFPQGQNVKL